jgi:adenosylcobyric acid synthase
VPDSFGICSSRADFVLRERAGSPAEVNLREGDIANMGFAVPFIVERTGWTHYDVVP